MSVKKRKKPKSPPGLPAERLNIEGDWKDAVKKSLEKKKPKKGWPKDRPHQTEQGQ